MSKHTPGPWEVIRQDDGSLAIVNNNGDIITYAFDLSDDINALQNANLIAAAPELLAALYEALPFINDDDGAYKAGYAKKVEQRILAAINKAEGKA
jgi:hypothetical protein